MGYLDLDYMPQVEEANQAAQNIIGQLQGMFIRNKRAFEHTSETFWANPNVTPQQIADVLGTNAGGIFALHAKLGELLAMVDPTSVEHGLSFVGEFTTNEDGTVTVIPPPSPEA